MADTLYFVIPCYKEEEVLPLTAPVFVRKLRALIAAGLVSENSRVLFVNDGSPDRTWETICAQHSADPLAIGIDLEKNSGEKNALLAGMYYAAERADFVITMDCDLQDDIEAADEMIRRYYEGNDLVLGVRSERGDDPLSQRFFSAAFYFMMRVMRTGLVSQHSNFRLMSRRAVEALHAYDAVPYFLPAAASTLPFPKTTVSHARAARPAGESKYNYKSLTRLAVDAVLVHSALLPRLAIAGACLCTAAFIAGAILLLVFGLRGQGFSGWAFVLTLGGALGALGFAVMGAWLARLGLYKTYAQKSGISRVRAETGDAGKR
ncbi:MAG: glycosyltransferase family 2 protein [Clostridia bacterium]|nr:glycosyltransferase family 2 protein [Clostridia bacterium]